MTVEPFDLQRIRKLCIEDKLRWTNHMLVRLLQRGISLDDVTHCLKAGLIIESYPDDYPYPSHLLLGTNIAEQPLHVVCAIVEDELWLITAYYPSTEKWENDMKTRKGHKQ